MRAARIRMDKHVLLELLHLPWSLAIEAHPTYSSVPARAIEFILEGEDLPAEFVVAEGEMISEATLEYRQTQDAEGKRRTIELVALRKVS